MRLAERVAGQRRDKFVSWYPNYERDNWIDPLDRLTDNAVIKERTDRFQVGYFGQATTILTSTSAEMSCKTRCLPCLLRPNSAHQRRHQLALSA